MKKILTGVVFISFLAFGSIVSAATPKVPEVSRLANAGLELFCFSIKYNASSQQNSGAVDATSMSPFDAAWGHKITPTEKKILKKYGFKNQMAYIKMLEKYEKSKKLSKSLGKIQESASYQKQYSDCMSETMPSE